MQSIDKELRAANHELERELESVARAHGELQNLLASSDMGMLFLDPSLRIRRFTPRLAELFGLTSGDEGRPIADFSHELNHETFIEDARGVLRDVAAAEREVQSRSGDWYLVRIRPYRTSDGRIDGVIVSFIDISERRRAEEALRASETRLRQQMRLVELSRSPIFAWDFDGGIVEWNRGSEELYGYSREEALGRPKEHLLHTEVPGSSFERLRASLLEEGRWTGDLLHRTKDGRQLTVESELELMPMDGRRLVLESTRDVTDRKRWERRQQMLLSELNHRVRNTLAVVQALARRTLPTSASPELFVEAFEGRLTALANAHRLLADSDWKGAELGELARSQLEAYAARDPGRVQVEGDPVWLPPHQATPFGLILHELATNAAKYGALSSEHGKVTLAWQVDRDATRRLTLVWREEGGPRVAEPETHGLGGALIEGGLSEAEVRRQFLPGGLVCSITLEIGPEPDSDGEET